MNINQLLEQKYTGRARRARALTPDYLVAEFTGLSVKVRWVAGKTLVNTLNNSIIWQLQT